MKDILEKRTIPGKKSEQLLKISKTYEPPCMADQVPVVWDHGEGVYVWDVDGNKYIDFTSGVLVTNIGHSHPHHVKAIQQQAARLMNCYSFPTPERVTLSEARKLPKLHCALPNATPANMRCCRFTVAFTAGPTVPSVWQEAWARGANLVLPYPAALWRRMRIVIAVFTIKNIPTVISSA